jgi:broad specificity phosphatase PhoE
MGVREFWLVRHGESLANVAAGRAEAEGVALIDVDLRDADVPLTPLGEEQAAALGAWLADHEPPGTVWCSPYLRARETARIALASAGLSVTPRVDERLRDRELGILDRVTSHGVVAHHADEAARRLHLGKFWYRPPGGESWADVALRLRSVLEQVERGEGVVLIVAHDVVVTLVVYVLLGMSEAEILDLAGRRVVGNATVTRVARTDDRWELTAFADTEHLHAEDVPATAHDEETNADVL